MTPQPYRDMAAVRVCVDTDDWQTWVWDGTSRDSLGHPLLEEVLGDDTECAHEVDQMYGPLWWYRLEPTDRPGGMP